MRIRPTPVSRGRSACMTRIRTISTVTVKRVLSKSTQRLAKKSMDNRANMVLLNPSLVVTPFLIWFAKWESVNAKILPIFTNQNEDNVQLLLDSLAKSIQKESIQNVFGMRTVRNHFQLTVEVGLSIKMLQIASYIALCIFQISEDAASAWMGLKRHKIAPALNHQQLSQFYLQLCRQRFNRMSKSGKISR